MKECYRESTKEAKYKDFLILISTDSNEKKYYIEKKSWRFKVFQLLDWLVNVQ